MCIYKMILGLMSFHFKDYFVNNTFKNKDEAISNQDGNYRLENLLGKFNFKNYNHKS